MRASEILDEKGGLGKWFKERWVDISRKEGGKHPECGASADDDGRDRDVTRAYPKCVPATKARAMDAAEKRSATRRKREVERGPDGDRKTPNYVKTKTKD